MNLALLRNRFRQAANLPEPDQLFVHAAFQVLKHAIEPLASREPQPLEVKIGDDFDKLPRETAEDFWAEAFGESSASLDVRSAAGLGADDRARDW